MPIKRRKNDVDIEVDLHGYTAEEMIALLRDEWPGWRGMVRVRLVHGRGSVLKPALDAWCAEMGIPFEMEPNNPGSALIYPSQRTLPNAALSVTLKDKGLSLTPQEQADLNDPESARKRIAQELARRQEEERKRRSDAASQQLKMRQDEALWRAEMSRLDGMEKRRTGKSNSDLKPAGPIVRPAAEIKHQEGWWKAELVRVADTDTDTLQVQKRTGLDKLAPPVVAVKPESVPEPPKSRKAPRDTAADQALFEEELARLNETNS